MDMFFQDDDETIEVDNLQIDLGNTSQSYEELVKDFVLEENQYLRDLNMIIRVFREPFVRLYSRSKVLIKLLTTFVISCTYCQYIAYNGSLCYYPYMCIIYTEYMRCYLGHYKFTD